jgi:hypothetical protein
MGSFTLPSAMRDFKQRGSFRQPERAAPVTQMGRVGGNMAGAMGKMGQIKSMGQTPGWGQIGPAGGGQAAPPVQRRPQPQPQPRRRADITRGRRERPQRQLPQRPQVDPNQQFDTGFQPAPASGWGGAESGNIQGQLTPEMFMTGGNMASAGMPVPPQAANMHPAQQFQTGLWGGGADNLQGRLDQMRSNPVGTAMPGGNMANFGAPRPQVPQGPGEQDPRRRLNAGQTGQGAGWGFLTNG